MGRRVITARTEQVRGPVATQIGFRIADAVRYVSVHSWKQPDSHERSGASQPLEATAREAGDPQLTGRFRR